MNNPNNSNNPNNPSNSSNPRATQSASNSHNARSSIVDQFDRHFERLFSRKIEIFGSVKATRVSPYLGVFKALCKALVELIRLQPPLYITSFHQLQIDLLCLRIYAGKNRFISPDDHKTIVLLLDEVHASGVDRSRVKHPGLSQSELAEHWNRHADRIFKKLSLISLPTFTQTEASE